MTEGRMSQENASFFLGCLLLPPPRRQCRSLRAGLQLLLLLLATAALICHGCQVPLPCTIMVSTRIPTSQLASQLIGNGIMKAKSVYNNMKQQSRSCGIEDNASFAPTNGRDRTDRQDRQTYRHRTKQPRTMYCLCLLHARKLVLYAHTGHQNYAFHHGHKRLTMDRLKYEPHTSQVPTQISDLHFRLF